MLEASAKAANGERMSQIPGWDGKKHPVPEEMGPGAAQSVQGRVTGAPYENVPAGYALGPLYSILNIIMQTTHDEIIPWSIWPMLRDRQLRKLWRSETIMSGALYAMAGRVSALPWQITTPQTRIQARYQSLIANSDFGEGARSLFSKTVLDMLSTDNGAFWELLGAGAPDKPLVGPVLGVAHIDSNLIWRTHDSEIPAIYINPYTGRYHGIHRSRIVRMSSMPQPEELARGVGFCSVSRVERWLKIAYAEANYKDEKISGRFKRGLIYGSGATTKQFDAAIGAANAADNAAGLTAFSNIPVLLTMQPDLKLNTLDLAKLPDGFDFEKEITLYVYVVALALGTDAREIWPATASGATKADANTQHLKAQGKGIADILQTIERALNWYVLPEGVEFSFDFTDEERELLNAQINMTRAQTLNLLAATGGLAADQVQKMAIHQEIIDPDALVSPDIKIVAGDQAPIVPGDDPTEIKLQEQLPGDIEVKSKQKIDPSAVVSDFDSGLQGMLDTLKGKLDSSDSDETLKDWLLKTFHALLIEALRSAYSVGLGDNLPTQDWLDKLQSVAEGSYGYFTKSFTPDLIDGWAEETDASADEYVDSFRSRMSLYAGAAWQALWLGLGDQLSQFDEPPRVMRMLNPDAEHCGTCPDKEGIYDDFDSMLAEAGLPGDLSDDCGTKCRCTLKVESDSGEFVDLLGEPDIANVPDFEVG